MPHERRIRALRSAVIAAVIDIGEFALEEITFSVDASGTESCQ